MRVVIQRVKRASVAVEQEGVDEATTAPQDVVSEIGKGIVCLVGVNEADEADDALWICKQITSAKLFEGMSEANADKRWRSSVKQNGFEILLVSQVRFNTGLRFHRRCAKLEVDFPDVCSTRAFFADHVVGAVPHSREICYILSRPACRFFLRPLVRCGLAELCRAGAMPLLFLVRHL